MKDSLNNLPARKKHKLARIVSIIRQSTPVFFKTFPLDTDEERRCFDLLRHAYVGARYHEGYVITPEELKYLARCVELLREQTEASCERKMELFV